METPRPRVDVDAPIASIKIRDERRRSLKRSIPKLDKRDRARNAQIIYKYRKLQERTYEDIEDPDPYDPDYIFYCLQPSK